MYNWPERKKLRFENYDYSKNWFYFITICTKNRVPVRIIIIVGNEYFRSDNWNYNNNENRNENIHSLPNISNIIKGFKIWCTKEIRNKHNNFQFTWQKSFYDVIIKNDEQLQKTRQYILDNPIKWKDDVNYKSE